MKSLLAIVGGLFVLGFYAQAGDSCKPSTTHPASVCQPVVAHIVHCHTTNCCYPCGYACARVCAPHLRVAHRAYCSPSVKVKIRRQCLPRTIYYRTCLSSCCW